MPEEGDRLTDPDGPPTLQQVQKWIGKAGYEYWSRTADMIEQRYPGVFEPEWLYGGKKYGWALRYKKSRSFCTFAPEKGYFKIQIVFGAKERDSGRYVANCRTQRSKRTTRRQPITMGNGFS